MPENEEVKEQVTEQVEDKPEGQQEQVEAPAQEETPAGEQIHPLEPGGQRFADVYARMREAERRAQDLERELANRPQPQAQPRSHRR